MRDLAFRRTFRVARLARQTPSPAALAFTAFPPLDGYVVVEHVRNEFIWLTPRSGNQRHNRGCDGSNPSLNSMVPLAANYPLVRRQRRQFRIDTTAERRKFSQPAG